MASGQPHENRPKDRRKLWLWAGVFLLVASAIFWVRVLIAVIACEGRRDNVPPGRHKS